MSSNEGADSSIGQTYSFEAVANRVGAFFVLYDPYRVDDARREIARFDTTRMVDAPEAKVIVLMPTLRQHLQSGSYVDFDVLRTGVDVVGVFDSDSARRVGRALNGTDVRVVLLPSPKIRDVLHFDELPDRQKLPGMAATLQLLFDIPLSEAKSIASEILEERREQHGSE